MLIRNVKSYADLAGKKKLQDDLLELSVANESELEKRVKDYKNPNKPVPVAPEYKSNAELQRDRLAQERQAIANMEEFGFDYNKSADIVGWLSSSLINRLVEFNANFRGIKKELTENTNPKLLNVDYIKNYLENYFEDMDVNYGRKFGKRETDGITQPTTIDEFKNILPTSAELETLNNKVVDDIGRVRSLMSGIDANIEVVKEQFKDFSITTEEYRKMNSRNRDLYNQNIKQSEKIIRDFEDAKKNIPDIIRKMRLVASLLSLYANVIPNDDFLEIMKLSLTQQQRADLMRRYAGILRSLRILDRSGVNELLDEYNSLNIERDTEGINRISTWLNKAMKSLSFITNDANVNKLSKLQRDYETLLGDMGKEADVSALKRWNDIQEKKIKDAKEVYDDILKTDIPIDLSYEPESGLDIGSYKIGTRNLRMKPLKNKTEVSLKDIREWIEENPQSIQVRQLTMAIRDNNTENQEKIVDEIRNIIASGRTLGVSIVDDLEKELAVDNELKSIKQSKKAKSDIGKAIKGFDGEILQLLEEVDTPERPSKLKPYTEPAQPADKRVKRIPIPYVYRDINVLAPKLVEKMRREGKNDREITLEVRKLIREVEEANKQAKIKTTTQISTSPEGSKVIQEILQNKAEFIDEIREIARQGDEEGAEKTLKTFIMNVVSDKKQKYTYKNLKDKNFDDLAVIVSNYVDKKIENYQKSGDIRDIDWIKDLKQARVYQGNDAFPKSTTKYGVGTKGRGLPKKIIKHLREDDAENKALSKAFKKHMKIEKEVNGDSSDEEKGGALSHLSSRRGETLQFKHKKIKVGKGISVEAQPAYKTFGKYVIHMGHLIDKNVANFKYPSLGSIPAIKPLTVSDDYKDFIMDTLENGKPNERIFSKLPQEEQKHFERVVLGAGLLDAFKLRRTKSDGEKKDADRFNILRGEVMAGNNSEKVIKELRGLIIRFMNEGRIQQKEGTGMLVELSAI